MSEVMSAKTRKARLSAEVVARFKREAVAEYVRRHPRSGELHRRAQAALPGGDTRTVTFYEPFPLYIERGAHCRLHDVDGHTPLDLLLNYTSMIWGHAHPYIVEAGRRQLERGTGFAAPTEMQIRLGEMLRERVPSVERVRFTNSGTEAVMHAIRAARAFTGRDKIVKMEGAYHGSYDAVEISVHPSLDAAGPAKRPTPVPDTRGLPAAALRDTVIAPFNDTAGVEAILREGRREIAAVLVEPVQGIAGTLPAAPEFLRALRALTQELGIVLIFDEVISFRLGYGGAQGTYGVRPDLTTFGKIIGGGFPVGGFGGREEIMRQYDPHRPGALSQSGTFSANPVTMAAGVAGLELLTADEIERINRLGDRLREGLQATFDASPVPARVTGTGSLLTLQLTDVEVTNYRHAATVDRELASAFHLALINHGLFSATRGMMALSLPMSEAEVDEALGAARAALGEMAAIL